MPVPLGQVRALIADFETERANWQVREWQLIVSRASGGIRLHAELSRACAHSIQPAWPLMPSVPCATPAHPPSPLQTQKPVTQSNSPLLFIAPGSPVPQQLLDSVDSFDLDTLLQMDMCDLDLSGMDDLTQEGMTQAASPAAINNYSKLFISSHVRHSWLDWLDWLV